MNRNTTTIQSLLESSNPWTSVQNEANKLKSKWGKTPLLEGLNDSDKNTMSIILENQAKRLVMESNTTGGTSGFTTGTGENWAGIALPLVRKIFGQIAIKEFGSVQPMTMPNGLVFFLDIQFDNNKSPFAAGSSIYGKQDSVRYPFSNTAAEGGLYGAGRFTYSDNQFSASGAVAVTSASWAELNFDSTFSASVAAGGVKKAAISASLLPNADLSLVKGFVLTSGSNVSADNNLMAFTRYSESTGVISFFTTGSAAPTLNGTYTAYYQKSTTDKNRGDFEPGGSYSIPNAANNTEIDIPKFKIQMKNDSITAKTRRLAATWTPEFAQDLNAYQSLDAEVELTNIMSEYISTELELEFLDLLIEGAMTTEVWSAVNNSTLNAAGTDFTASLGFFNTQGAWFQTLGTKMQKISNKIHQLTFRGSANFAICSPMIGTILESIPGYASSSDGDASASEYQFGTQKAGTINGRMKIYKNPYMTSNTMLIGYRGNQFLEAGAVFAPYIPLIMTPLVYDPKTFTPNKGLLTRYAMKMLRPEYYAKLHISGLDSI